MNQEKINIIMSKMTNILDNMQLLQLKKVLEEVDSEEKNENDSGNLLNRFISTKRLEGRSERTLSYYQMTIEKMLDSLNKNVRAITTDDLRQYLSDYQESHNVCNMSVDNIRRNLSSFFNWLEDGNYILKSPVRRIHRIKSAASVKEAYSDDEIERLRDNCNEIRDLALIEMLASTGMRIGELVLLNRDDIDFIERECKVLGKGDKERIVYFDARTKLHLQEYLTSREDDNEALFVGLRNPHNRVTINGIELRIRNLGRTVRIWRLIGTYRRKNI